MNGDASWIVWRQDDNGVVEKVAALATQAEARRLIDELEAKGHKQVYWVEAPAVSL